MGRPHLLLGVHLLRIERRRRTDRILLTAVVNVLSICPILFPDVVVITLLLVEAPGRLLELSHTVFADLLLTQLLFLHARTAEGVVRHQGVTLLDVLSHITDRNLLADNVFAAFIPIDLTVLFGAAAGQIAADVHLDALDILVVVDNRRVFVVSALALAVKVESISGGRLVLFF